jgi:hypothetical protein
MAVSFYILNIMILNVVVFKNSINFARYGTAVLLPLSAILTSSNAKI